MKLHELKIKSKYHCDVKKGNKTFELRKDDRGYEVGDLINFKEIRGTQFISSKEVYRITYILRDCLEYGLADGYCILGIKKLEEGK